MKNKFSLYEAICLIVLVTISQIILGLPEYLINLTGTGTAVNLIFLSAIVFGLSMIISNIFKNFSNSDIIDISEFVGGKILKFILSVFFLFFLIFAVVLEISNFLYLIRSIYFSELSYLFVLAFFLVVILISNIKGVYSIKKITAIFCPILLLSIVFLLLGESSNFNSNNFFPIFGYSYKTTFFSGIQNIFIFNFIFIYLFLMPLLAKKNNYKKVVIWSFFINTFLLLFSVIAILSFYPTIISKSITNLKTINVIYALTRKIQITDFLSQTDALFIFFWSFGIFAYTSFLTYGIIYIFNKLFSFEDNKQTVYPIISIILGGCLLLNKLDLIKLLETSALKYFSIIFIFGISFGILILGYFKNKKKSKKGLKNNVKNQQ